MGLDIFILFPDVGFSVTFYVLGAFCLFLLFFFVFLFLFVLKCRIEETFNTAKTAE